MNTKQEPGFTLVELMVAMVSAAVLALVVGAILVFTTSSMARFGINSTDDTRGIVNLQRDAAVAFMALNRVVRGASFTNIGFGYGPSRLDVGSTVSFYVSGRSLMYNSAGMTNVLVNGRLKNNGFFWSTSTNLPRTVTVSLGLTESGADLDARETIRVRNP